MEWILTGSDLKDAGLCRHAFMAALTPATTTGSDLGAAELIFGELVGNALEHGKGPVNVCVRWDEDQPVLEVRDRGPVFDQRTEPWHVSAHAMRGRGLQIVRKLSTRLTTVPDPDGGMVVTAKLPVWRRDGWIPEPPKA